MKFDTPSERITPSSCRRSSAVRGDVLARHGPVHAVQVEVVGAQLAQASRPARAPRSRPRGCWSSTPSTRESSARATPVPAASATAARTRPRSRTGAVDEAVGLGGASRTHGSALASAVAPRPPRPPRPSSRTAHVPDLRARRRQRARARRRARRRGRVFARAVFDAPCTCRTRQRVPGPSSSAMLGSRSARPQRERRHRSGERASLHLV